jgi:hypothetical protein
MDYKQKYLKYYKKYLNLIDSNFEQTHGGLGEFEKTQRLYIMYKGIGLQNQKALTERARVLLGKPNLYNKQPSNRGHLTLLDITFNTNHRLYQYIRENKDIFKKDIETYYNMYLRGVKITHERDSYKLMGPFWGKIYNLEDHTKMIEFRDKIFELIQHYVRESIIEKEIKLINGKPHYYYGLREDSVENSLYCVPEYHLGDNWVGHISVIKFDNTRLPLPDNLINSSMNSLIGHRDTQPLNYYKERGNSEKVNDILNAYIKKYFKTPDYVPIYYGVEKEFNEFGFERQKVMPWTHIIFQESTDENTVLDISFTSVASTLVGPGVGRPAAAPSLTSVPAVAPSLTSVPAVAPKPAAASSTPLPNTFLSEMTTAPPQTQGQAVSRKNPPPSISGYRLVWHEAIRNWTYIKIPDYSEMFEYNSSKYKEKINQ